MKIFDAAFAAIPQKIRFWLKRGLTFLLILIVFWGGVRACYWISPSEPDLYRIGIDSTWYPMNLYGKEQQFTAFANDLLSKIAQNQQLHVEIVRSGPKVLQDLLDDGKYNGILSSINPDLQGEDKYYFSEPFYRLGAVFVVRKDFDFKSLQNLPQMRIGVNRGSSILYHMQIDPSISVQPYTSPLIALDNLIRGELDGVVMDQLLAYLYFGSLYGDKLKIATLPLTVEGLRLVTLQDKLGADLIDKFNIGLKNLKADGTYKLLLQKWDLFNPEQM